MIPTINVDKGEAFNRKLQRGFRRAARRAVDTTATEGRRIIVREIAEKTGTTQRELNKRVRVIERTRQNTLVAVIGIEKSAIRISEFSPITQSQTVSVIADIDVRTGTEFLRTSFSPINHSSRNEIYQRVRRGGQRVSRYPIRKALGPSAAQMFGPLATGIIARLEQRLGVRLNEEMIREFIRLGVI